jgi:hypothetical protein
MGSRAYVIWPKRERSPRASDTASKSLEKRSQLSCRIKNACAASQIFGIIQDYVAQKFECHRLSCCFCAKDHFVQSEKMQFFMAPLFRAGKYCFLMFYNL